MLVWISAHDKSIKLWHFWFVLLQPEKGTPSLPEASFHYFNFTHCTKQNVRHYRQASSKISIQKIHLSTEAHATCDFSMILCALHFETLQITNNFHFTTLWRRTFSAITYSNRLSVMWIRFIGHLCSSRAFPLQLGTHCSKQRAETKKAHGNTNIFL